MIEATLFYCLHSTTPVVRISLEVERAVSLGMRAKMALENKDVVHWPRDMFMKGEHACSHTHYHKKPSPHCAYTNFLSWSISFQEIPRLWRSGKLFLINMVLTHATAVSAVSLCGHLRETPNKNQYFLVHAICTP